MINVLAIKWHAVWFNVHSKLYSDALLPNLKDHHLKRMMYHIKKSYRRVKNG